MDDALMYSWSKVIAAVALVVDDQAACQ